MIKLFFKFLFVAVLFFVLPAVSFAEISQIKFVTDPQTIKPGVLSGPIKIQFQNSDGTAASFGETQQLFLESSSGDTGEFLNDSGEPISKTINSNWTSRTFYYRDSAEGIFNITASIVGTSIMASQQIIVSSGASQNNTDTSGEVLGASDSSSTQTSSTQISGGGSTVERASSLNAQLEVLAGSDRATSPGSPIWFQATVKKNTTGTGPVLSWSFGDGNVGAGPLVSHTYKYPGDYVVVLSSVAGDIFSVSRLKVKVMEPSVSVRDGGEYLEISNESGNEINLFKWKVENEGKGFIFQPNTIILPHSSIRLDKNLLTMKGHDNTMGTCIENSFGEEVFGIAPVKEINIEEVSKNLDNIRQEALVIKSRLPSPKIETAKIEAVAEDLPEETLGDGNIIYEAPKRAGFVSRLTNFIKRVFSN